MDWKKRSLYDAGPAGEITLRVSEEDGIELTMDLSDPEGRPPEYVELVCGAAMLLSSEEGRRFLHEAYKRVTKDR